MLRNSIALLVCVFAINITTQAQSDQELIKKTIDQLFTSMKNGDSSLCRSVISSSAVLQTIAVNKEGKTSVRTENINEFIGFIGGLKKGVADERITYESILIDGSLAHAWTPYQFYYDGKFSHCGVNSFELVKIDGNWKIQYIIDTRRKEGCK